MALVGAQKPTTAALSIFLTILVVGVLWSNMQSTRNLASVNRDAVNNNSEVIGALSRATEELVKQQTMLVEQQKQMVALQERVTGFSDSQIKARRAQGVRVRTLLDLCSGGLLRGKACENLPDANTLEMLER